ncbi:MAG TPA: 16S rRNA (guanine(527)-N(7))-methyltransferase RsmG [Solirubrobacteraceae bacterium]|nr:16S rRNA (guanine(527)-N(7))-methyltransferase RsmG [Solirubrobacteraceae bacterium]
MSDLSVRGGLLELADRFALPAGAAEALERLLDLVSDDPHAPTSVRDPAIAVSAHVADALVALDLDVVRSAGRIADLGSGAGFPGLVLALALPDAQVALVESSGRKCGFLERAVEATGVSNVDIACERAEEWRTGIGSRDLVTARAVAPLSVVVEYAAPLLAKGGALVAWKGRRDAAEEADGAAAAQVTGLAPAGIVAVEPWIGAEHLHLHVFSKVRETPDRFPRRPGIANKRPLRA